jgi:hypothetical protein
VQGISWNGLPATLTAGLVLYYDFDKDEEDKVTDLSGKGNHGSVFWGEVDEERGCYGALDGLLYRFLSFHVGGILAVVGVGAVEVADASSDILLRARGE